MFSDQLMVLAGTAAVVGLLHTLMGPDHYLPFVMLSRARGWSRRRTAVVTAVCGLGHVGGSVILGTVGIAAGLAVARVEGIESVRGTVAAWLLIGFGLAYGAWGLRRTLRAKPHSHTHKHPGGLSHSHQHTHNDDHFHLHEERAGAPSIIPWTLFIVFVLGPCEPLIPLLMFPAATKSGFGVALVASTFGLVTIGTMMVVVLASASGLRAVRLGKLDRYSHALAGLTIIACGVLILAGF